MDIIERVARAICQANQVEPDSDSQTDGNACQWEDYAEDARAAIAAMREPTDAMIEVGEMKANDLTQPDWSPIDIASRTYTAMIDAALVEK